MSDKVLYILIAAVFIILLVSTIILYRNIFFGNRKKKPSKDIKKRMLELRNNIKANPKDFDSIYELAVLLEQCDELEEAFEKYEILVKEDYFNDNSEIDKTDIYKKMESFSVILNNMENVLKYAMKITKEEPKNIYYIIKVGTILGKEGKFKMACDYFNKALLSKKEFDIEQLKTASLSFYMAGDHKKSIVFLEELHKKVVNELKNENKNEIKKVNEDRSDLNSIEDLLISLYVSVDELSIASSFIENILRENILNIGGTDDNHKLYINKIYMYILYKLSNSEKFIETYNNLIQEYKLDNANEQYADLVLDFGFYSYFLKDISSSIKYFNMIKSFNIPEFDSYNIDKTLSYLAEVNKANTQLAKLRGNNSGSNNEKFKNERYEKYVDKESIEAWENTLNLWESSFLSLDDMPSLIQIENTIDVEKIILENNAEKSSYNKNKASIMNEVDKIYSLSLNNFKKLCQNIIQSKLSHSILQEYLDNIISYDYGDEANYLTYHINKGKKDLTLISFKRWKNTEVGELILRDFLLMVNESGAKHGILVLPVTLSKSAKSYALHNDKITVYSRNQFNAFLKNSSL